MLKDTVWNRWLNPYIFSLQLSLLLQYTLCHLNLGFLQKGRSRIYVFNPVYTNLQDIEIYSLCPVNILIKWYLDDESERVNITLPSKTKITRTMRRNPRPTTVQNIFYIYVFYIYICPINT